MKRIEIGCGVKRREGYESCDIRPLPGVDHVCRADDLPFADGSVDEVYSRHVVEHFTLREFLAVLAEWNRVLRQGGEIYIICPNLLWHLRQILDGEHESLYVQERGRNHRYWGFGSLFGWQQDEHDVHKFGYYFELLRDILQSAGFADVEDLTGKPTSLEHAEHHLEVRARKRGAFLDPRASRFFTLLEVKH